jgi:hypothetical protein
MTIVLINLGYACPSKEHCVKSICFPQLSHKWVLSNSSEKISFSRPQFGHLQLNDESVLKFAKPGQCFGVDITSSLNKIASQIYVIRQSTLPDCTAKKLIDFTDKVFRRFHGHNPEPSEHLRRENSI